MMRVHFTNPRVAKEFTAAEGFPDRVVNIPKLYQGPLSNISFAGALKMVESKSNLIFKNEKKVKEPAAETPTPETD